MPRPTVHRTPFGSAHGTETGLWTLDSGTGVRAEVLTYGASLHRLTVPDTAGSAASVVRSLATIDDYTGKHPYFGAVVGRYANRIAHGRFSLDGATHHIPANDRGHALHGGPEGFHTKIWDATSDTTDSTASVRLTLHSPDGDMGFPGALDVSVTYTLDTAGTLAVDYASVTDRATVVNLTNHAYFELAATGTSSATCWRSTPTPTSRWTATASPRDRRSQCGVLRSTSPRRASWGSGRRSRTNSCAWRAASTTAGCSVNPPAHRRGTAPRRPAHRPRRGPRPGGVDDGARHPGLHRQPARRLVHRRRRPVPRPPRRGLSGDPAPTRLAQPARPAQHRTASRRDGAKPYRAAFPPPGALRPGRGPVFR